MARLDDNGCWIFNPKWGYVDDVHGYAMIRKSAHRLTYDIFVGEIPEGYVIDHLCEIKSCINPAHLEAVTPSENAVRGFGKLTDQDVQEIRDLRAKGVKLRIIAEEYGVRPQYVSALCLGQYR